MQRTYLKQTSSTIVIQISSFISWYHFSFHQRSLFAFPDKFPSRSRNYRLHHSGRIIFVFVCVFIRYDENYVNTPLHHADKNRVTTNGMNEKSFNYTFCSNFSFPTTFCSTDDCQVHTHQPLKHFFLLKSFSSQHWKEHNRIKDKRVRVRYLKCNFHAAPTKERNQGKTSFGGERSDEKKSLRKQQTFPFGCFGCVLLGESPAKRKEKNPKRKENRWENFVRCLSHFLPHLVHQFQSPIHLPSATQVHWVKLSLISFHSPFVKSCT